MRSWCTIDLRDVEGALREAQSAIRFGAVRGVALAAREGLAEAKARRRYRDRTGNLTGKAYARLLSVSGQDPRSEIGWPVPYASLVEGGTRAHTILPKLGAGFIGPPQAGQGRRGRGRGRQFLAFPGRSGAVVFARKVNHPGTKPDPFGAAAYLKAEAVLIREIEIGIAKAQEILAR